MNFVLNVGAPMGRGEPVVQPAAKGTDGSTVAGFCLGERESAKGKEVLAQG